MKFGYWLRLLTLVAAMLAQASCGGGSGSDILRIINPLAEPITVMITFPNGNMRSVRLDRSGGGAETIINTSYTFGDIYTFDAVTETPGIAPADTTTCTVAQIAVMTGATDTQVFTSTGATQLTIECSGNWQEEFD